MAVASPSVSGLVAIMTSCTSPSATWREAPEFECHRGQCGSEERSRRGAHDISPDIPCPFQGNEIPGLSHYANYAVIPAGIGADGAQILICEVLTHRAGFDFVLGFHNGVGKGLGFLLWKGQDVEGQTLRSFGANARQPAKLLAKPLQGGRKYCMT